MDMITELTRVLRARRAADPESSYVASLYAQGLNKILEKVGEEATEVIVAAKDAERSESAGGSAGGSAGDGTQVIQEVADLWFHTLVMLVHLDQEPQQVLDTLAERFGVSGHVEKASRQGK